MRVIHLGDVEIQAQGSPWAVFLYQREFSTPDHKVSWYEDYEQTTDDFEYSQADDATQRQTENIVRSVSALDAMFCLKTLWACAACHDEAHTPPYEKWLKQVSAEGDIPLSPFSSWKLEVSALINAEIFRYRAKAKPETAEGSTETGE